MAVCGIYVEKKAEFAVEARAVRADLKIALGIRSVQLLRLINRYFVEGISQADFESVQDTVFSEPQLDITYPALPEFPGARVFAVEYLPGQFDQRADSCAQCISFAIGGERPLVRSARIYVLEGEITDEEFARIKAYLINPVESREAELTVPQTLAMRYEKPEDVPVIEGFTALNEQGLQELLQSLGLAMDLADLTFCQQYFCKEGRDPTLTEIRMIDTYWSDHCRHTTFLTHLTEVETESPYIKSAYERYLALREELYGSETLRPVTLMDMATIGARKLKRDNLLNRLDESEEINACSVSVRIEANGVPEDWLLMFKNETHNHPTEIEPFGGAATCLGGAIRDPLSGRSYVYQAMRITGAGNPLPEAPPTLPGKLPQRKITQTAAAGYSSYGNQIGLATGLVHEFYHPGYVAKRMELGALLGAAPASHVVRERPVAEDVVILLGGRTGRDGCGGATGSSKSHTQASLESCGAEVQKGNAPEERKIQRLFRNPAATRMIKRCNDFGAGGVAVAIGELADGLEINLDAVPKKYEGLTGTELAISESQERMAVVVNKADVQRFVELASRENLEATPVATVTEAARLRMQWRGKTIVDLSRDFLNSNGAAKSARVKIAASVMDAEPSIPVTGESLCRHMADLRNCSQKGLVERFDSSVGAGTVLLPFGGKYARTPAQTMSAKFPVPGGNTNNCSLMAFGFDPYRSSQSPYHGAMEAVVESVAKVLAAGGTRTKTWLTFQEYFERLGDSPERWGKPTAALLGALEAQLQLQVAAIGGKDSMSGSFEDINVPPTLVSIAVSVAKASEVISGEFKQPGHTVYFLQPSRTEDGAVNFDDARFIFDWVEEFIANGKVAASWAVGSGGTADAVPKMCFGNRLGFNAVCELTTTACVGGILLETTEPLPELENFLLGNTTAEYVLTLPGGERVPLEKIQSAWENGLEPVFPCNVPQDGPLEAFAYSATGWGTPKIKMAKPRVIIPAFPGTNCEYDTAAAFEKAGAEAKILVVRNLTAAALEESVREMEKELAGAQVLMIPGGFSGGDEPDGSGKFITSFFRGERLREAVMQLLQQRDGLACGICNGFQALIKLGLVPYGEICKTGQNSPTLAMNEIGRHQAMIVRTRIASNKSPWLRFAQVGDVYEMPISHGEGRFIADEETVRTLAQNGQIATQYVDYEGTPSMNIEHNPNGSFFAIEGITSPDGRVFGRMGHSERAGENLYRNMPPLRTLDIFKGAVEYFK